MKKEVKCKSNPWARRGKHGHFLVQSGRWVIETLLEFSPLFPNEVKVLK